MFGRSHKTSGGSIEEDRLAEWQRSPSVPVTKPTGLKTRLLLSNMGRELKAMYRNEPCVIRALSVFRKPAYNRMYVEAECNGETKILNIADLMLRRPDSDTYFDDEEPSTQRTSRPVLGTLTALAVVAAAVAIYFAAVPAEFERLVGKHLHQSPAPAAPPDQVNNAAPAAENAAPPEPVKSATPPVAPPEVAPSTPAPNEKPARPALGEDTSFGREFSDATGSFRVRAEFVEFQPDRGRRSRVLLRKADGSEIDVPMNRLSKDDQAWVRDEVKRRKQ